MRTLTKCNFSWWLIVLTYLVALSNAPKLYSQQTRFSQTQQNQLNEAERLNDEMVKLYKQGNAREAIVLAKQVLEIRRRILGAEHPDTATSINNLGLLLNEQGDADTARQYYEQALQIYKKVFGEEHRDTASTLNNLGMLFKKQGDYPAARVCLEQALHIRKKVLGEEHPATALSLNNLGFLFDGQGDYAAARPYYEQALQILNKVLGGEHPDTAMLLNNLGSLLQAQGDYAAARQYLEQALQINKKVLGDDHPHTARLLNNLGGLLYTQRDYAGARLYYEQALHVRKKVLGNEHPDTAATLNNLGLLFHDQGDYAVARPYYEQAHKIWKKVLGDNHPDTITSLNNLGALANAQGDYAAARLYYEQTLKSRKKVLGDEHPTTALSLNNLRNLEMATGNPLAAMSLTDQSRRGASRHIARVLPSLSDQEQLHFLERNNEVDFHVVLSLGLLNRAEKAIARASAGWLLNGKGVVQAAMAQRNLLTRDVKNPALAETIQKLIDIRRQLANQVLSVPQSGQEQSRREAIDQLTAQEATLTREVAQKTARPDLAADPWVELDAVRKAIPADGMLVEIARFPFFSFQAKGKEQQWQAAHYAVWLIPPTGNGDVEIIDLGTAAEIDSAVEKANKTLTEAGGANGPLAKLGAVEAEKIAASTLGRVRDLIWTPLSEKIPAGTKRLILSPDGNLWLLPWAALPLGEGKLLLDDFVLKFEISGRDLARPRGKLGAPGPSAIFADPDYDLSPAITRQSIQAIFPKLNLNDNTTRGALSQSVFSKVPRLPNTALEAEAVAPNMRQVAGADLQKYIGQYALEGVVKRVDRPKILMLSTHGFFLSEQEVKRDERLDTAASSDNRSAALLTVDGKLVENPLLRCGLLLAGCNSQQLIGGDEGVLTGMEVVSIDLRDTELVVLSACETGIGTVRNGQGVAGLRQAFQLAGAEAVVATLWQVPDRDSAIIMSDFFENLAAGQSRPEALRNAQLKRIQFRRDRDGAAHPFFWAAWTLTGK